MKKKVFQVSHTKMAVFRRCLQQYKWKYVDGYYTPSSMGQSRGNAGHKALAVWHTKYNKATSLQAAWDDWSSNGFEEGEDWWMLEAALERYFAWSKANDKFKLLEAEKEFTIELSKASASSFRFTGFIDGIVKDKNGHWLLENKFYQKMKQPTDMDTQISLYMLAATLLKYPSVLGVIYNMVRVADTKIAVEEPVVRKRIFKSQKGLAKVEAEMRTQVEFMKTYHEKGGTYRSVTNDCSWDCPYYQACLSMSDDGIEPVKILQSISSQDRRYENVEIQTSVV
jgi:hypothetical protein